MELIPGQMVLIGAIWGRSKWAEQSASWSQAFCLGRSPPEAVGAWPPVVGPRQIRFHSSHWARRSIQKIIGAVLLAAVQPGCIPWMVGWPGVLTPKDNGFLGLGSLQRTGSMMCHGTRSAAVKNHWQGSVLPASILPVWPPLRIPKTLRLFQGGLSAGTRRKPAVCFCPGTTDESGALCLEGAGRT